MTKVILCWLVCELLDDLDALVFDLLVNTRSL